MRACAIAIASRGDVPAFPGIYGEGSHGSERSQVPLIQNSGVRDRERTTLRAIANPAERDLQARSGCAVLSFSRDAQAP
jgi:hypothetical protein